jgi:hypothetical protein
MAYGKLFDLEQLSFVLCGIGLNVTFAIYLAYIKEYGVQFSRDILGWANVSIYVAASSSVGIAALTDRYVIKRIGSKVAYSVWIGLGLFVMAVTLLCIPFATSAVHVYTFGILIGIFEGKGLSTLMQLASAIEAETTKYVNTGFTIAQVVPIGLSVALGFHEAQASRSVDLAFAWIPSFFCLSALALFLAQVFLQGRFDESFERLDTLKPPSSSSNGAWLPLLAGQRENGGKFRWVSGPLMICAVVQFVTHAMSMFLMPFLTYFGGANLAHILVLVRFGGEMLGRIASHQWGFSFSECIKDQGPCILSWLVLIRFVVLAILMFGVFGVVHLGHELLLESLVGFFYFVFAWTHSEVMAIAVDLAPKDKVADFTQGMMFLCFSAQLLSLGMALPTVQALAASRLSLISGAVFP